MSPKKITFRYILDPSGEKIYKNITVYGTAYGGEDDTPKYIEEKAYQNALRNAIEKINGIHIQGSTLVINNILKQDIILANLLGTAQMISKEFPVRIFKGGNYEITCRASFKVPLIELVPES